MPRYVAFLRAINVGGRNVKMDALKKIFEHGGFRKVETLIASGNVLFDSTAAPDSLEKKIENLLQEELGYRVDTFIRSISELAEITRTNPFESLEGTVHIAFTSLTIEPAFEKEIAFLGGSQDRFHVHGRDLYWYTPGRTTDSPFSCAVLEKRLKRPATFRNLKTVRQLSGMK